MQVPLYGIGLHFITEGDDADKKPVNATQKSWYDKNTNMVNIRLYTIESEAELDRHIISGVISQRSLLGFLNDAQINSLGTKVFKSCSQETQLSLLRKISGNPDSKEDYAAAGKLYITTVAKEADRRSYKDPARIEWNNLVNTHLRPYMKAVCDLSALPRNDFAHCVGLALRLNINQPERDIALSRYDTSDESIRDEILKTYDREKKQLPIDRNRTIHLGKTPSILTNHSQRLHEGLELDLPLSAFFGREDRNDNKRYVRAGYDEIKKDKHPFSLYSIKDIASDLRNPLAIFYSKRNRFTTNVMLASFNEETYSKNNFVTPITAKEITYSKATGRRFAPGSGKWVNNIDSVYPKDAIEYLYWLSESKNVRYLSPSFEQDWLIPNKENIETLCEKRFRRFNAEKPSLNECKKILSGYPDYSSAREEKAEGPFKRLLHATELNGPSGFLYMYAKYRVALESATKVVKEFENQKENIKESIDKTSNNLNEIRRTTIKEKNMSVSQSEIKQEGTVIHDSLQAYLANQLANAENNPKYSQSINPDGIGTKRYGEYDYKHIEHAGFEEATNHIVVVEEKDGVKLSQYTLSANSYGEFKAGYSVIFYPDGQIKSFTHYSLLSGTDENLMSEELHFSESGKLIEITPGDYSISNALFKPLAPMLHDLDEISLKETIKELKSAKDIAPISNDFDLSGLTDRLIRSYGANHDIPEAQIEKMSKESRLENSFVHSQLVNSLTDHITLKSLEGYNISRAIAEEIVQKLETNLLSTWNPDVGKIDLSSVHKATGLEGENLTFLTSELSKFIPEKMEIAQNLARQLDNLIPRGMDVSLTPGTLALENVYRHQLSLHHAHSKTIEESLGPNTAMIKYPATQVEWAKILGILKEGDSVGIRYGDHYVFYRFKNEKQSPQYGTHLCTAHLNAFNIIDLLQYKDENGDLIKDHFDDNGYLLKSDIFNPDNRTPGTISPLSAFIECAQDVLNSAHSMNAYELTGAITILMSMASPLRDWEERCEVSGITPNQDELKKRSRLIATLLLVRDEAKQELNVYIERGYRKDNTILDKLTGKTFTPTFPLPAKEEIERFIETCQKAGEHDYYELCKNAYKKTVLFTLPNMPNDNRLESKQDVETVKISINDFSLLPMDFDDKISLTGRYEGLLPANNNIYIVQKQGDEYIALSHSGALCLMDTIAPENTLKVNGSDFIVNKDVKEALASGLGVYVKNANNPTDMTYVVLDIEKKTVVEAEPFEMLYRKECAKARRAKETLSKEKAQGKESVENHKHPSPGKH